MSGYRLLDEAHGRLRTRVGAAFPGTRAVFRGQDLHAELGDLDYLDLYHYGITGRRLSAAQLRLLHAIWVNTSYPDARLWNNRVAALAASARSPVSLGMTAAMAVSDAVVYGGQPGLWAMAFFKRMVAAVDAGASLADCVLAEARDHTVYGYGRPINSTDERIPWVMAKAKQLGLDKGRHIQIAFEIERILLTYRPQLKMNYAALHAAFAADMGLSVPEYHVLRMPVFMAGIAPCYVEASEAVEGTLLPLKCDDICYEGRGKRTWVAE